MASVCRVEITAHFRRNLDTVEAYLSEVGAPREFDALLDDLAGTIIPNLERFPDMGRDFYARAAGSVEAVRAVEGLRSLGGSGHLREYILPPYLLLYGRTEETIYLLSIRHHRQLSFDFPGLWGDV